MIYSFGRLAACFLLIMPWLWSISIQPLPDFLPYVFGYLAFFILLIFFGFPSLDEMGRAWIFAALITVFSSIVQFFSIDFFPYQWIFIPKTDFGVAIGFLRQPNLSATLLCIALVFGIYCIKNNYFRIIFAILIGFGEALFSSRTFIMEILFLLMIFFFAGYGVKKHNIFYLVCCFLSYIVFSYIIFVIGRELEWGYFRNIFFRFSGGEACSGRLFLWSNVLELVARHPITGWVWRGDSLQYAHYVGDFSGIRFCEVAGNAHNLLIQSFFYIGIPLSLIIFSLLVLFAARRRKIIFGDEKKFFCWITLFIIFLHSMVEYPMWYSPFQICFILCVKNIFDLNINKISVRGFSILMTLLIIFMTFDFVKISQAYIPEKYRIVASKNINEVVDYGKGTLFFQKEYLYSVLNISDVNDENAKTIYLLSNFLLRYYPQPAVIEKLMISSVLVKDFESFESQKRMYMRAFPKSFEEWRIKHNFETSPPASPAP
ncbi:MAG: Wzy polymerase domain-containing protein [Comamonas testosteroni]|uniref:PglL family O-oligosaccharyltransferase n=1 Tax=Comamonas testosteroni TaxID=285 RepID=UPI003D118F59